MSRFLLVELAENATHDRVLQAVLGVTDVRCVTDLDAISRRTLDQWLLPPSQTWEYKQRVPAIRNYHKRQPRLL